MDALKKEDGESLSIVDENIEALKAILPDAFTEGGIDFEVLRQLLGDELAESEEKYGLTWYGKKKARQIALTPSTGTLRPCPEESESWATTQNLFIEGDNLEVLKLLQKSYAGKIKMIYIDPPYNTGGEFIYPDKYQDNLDTYLRYTGQKDEEGFKLTSNTESHGRYHTNWMNMMYPRLKTARTLLSADGIIFISIDDNEYENLKKICSEIFGEENFVGSVCVVSNLKGRSDDKYLATAHNYLLAYSRGEFESYGIPLPEEYLDDYPETDDEGRRFRVQGLRKRGAGALREDRPNMYYPFYVNPRDGTVSLEEVGDFTEVVLPKLSDGQDGRWRWGKETAGGRLDELIGRQVGADARWDVFQIDYAEADGQAKRIKPKTLWMGSEFSNEAGTLEVKKLLGKGIFETPKPIGLIKYMLAQSAKDNDIVLDFFAGSCSTAHAVLEQNLEGNFGLRYIMIQLPEPSDEKSNAFKQGYKNIAEVGKERIRKAAEKIKENYPDHEGDLGFKVFKLDSSNIRAWNPDASDLEQTLLDHANHLVEGRREQDVLYELLLKRGVDLTVPIEDKEIAGKTVYSIGYGVLFACLDETIDKADIEALGQGITKWHKELEPAADTQVVFRDSAFADDIAKTNMTAILEQNGIAHVRSL